MKTWTKHKERVYRAAMRWHRSHTHHGDEAYYKTGERPLRRMVLWHACEIASEREKTK